MADARDEGLAAFETEVLPHLDAAYRVARTLTQREADAEDLVQESCLRAYRGFAAFRRGTNARAWLLTIVRHTFFNWCRQTKLRPLITPFPTVDERGSAAEPVDATAPGPEEQALQTLEHERLLQALERVPEPYRSVVALVDLGELQYAEAAAILGCPRGTIMSRLHRGRLLLAERFGIGATVGARDRSDGASLRRAGGGR